MFTEVLSFIIVKICKSLKCPLMDEWINKLWLNTHTHTHTYVSVQSVSHVQLFVAPWTAACQASLYITNSQSLLKLMSIELLMPFNHLILCHPLLLLSSIFPSITVFSETLSQSFASGGQGIGVSALTSVLQMNIQD